MSNLQFHITDIYVEITLLHCTLSLTAQGIPTAEPVPTENATAVKSAAEAF